MPPKSFATAANAVSPTRTTTTAPEQAMADLRHDVARLKGLEEGSNKAMTKAQLSSEHVQRVRKRFEQKGAGAGAGAGAVPAENLVYEVCLKELSDEELTLSEGGAGGAAGAGEAGAGGALAANVLTAKTKSSILMKKKTQDLLNLYPHPNDPLFITDVNTGYVRGDRLVNPYRHPEAGGEGGRQRGKFDISDLESKHFSHDLETLIQNLLRDNPLTLSTRRMYCQYIVFTRVQWGILISSVGKNPETQTLISKLSNLPTAHNIFTLADTPTVLLQIYETIDPDDDKGSFRYTNFTACVSVGTFDAERTNFTRGEGALDQDWICCTLFTNSTLEKCLVSFGGISPQIANSAVNPFVGAILDNGVLDPLFLSVEDYASFRGVCGKTQESKLKLAIAGASHKSGTDSNCRRFAREVVADGQYHDRTIHITTGDGWFFKILSEQLNGMLLIIHKQRKKVILEYTPDKICNLYGYTEADGNRIEPICLGKIELQRQNRIALAVAKGKETRNRNKIAAAEEEAAAAAAAGGSRLALVQGRLQRIQRRNSAIIGVAQAALEVAAAEVAAAEVEAAVEAAAAPAAAPAAAEVAEPTEEEKSAEALNLEAEAEADKDEDEDEDIYELLSQVSYNVVANVGSRHSLLDSARSSGHHFVGYSASSLPFSPNGASQALSDAGGEEGGRGLLNIFGLGSPLTNTNRATAHAVAAAHADARAGGAGAGGAGAATLRQSSGGKRKVENAGLGGGARAAAKGNGNNGGGGGGEGNNNNSRLRKRNHHRTRKHRPRKTRKRNQRNRKTRKN